MTERFSYQGKAYRIVAVEDMSLDDVIALEDELADGDVRNRKTGSVMQFGDIAELNPSSGLAILVGMWATLRAGGTPLPLAEVRKIPMTEFKELPATEDHRKASPKAPKSKRSAQTGSDPADETPPPPPSIVSVAS